MKLAKSETNAEEEMEVFKGNNDFSSHIFLTHCQLAKKDQNQVDTRRIFLQMKLWLKFFMNSYLGLS